MTEFINQPPNPEPRKPSSLERLIKKLKSSPKTVATGAVAIAALGSLGYWGIQVLVKQKLPPFLESQIGKIIERPINLGEVQDFSLGGIEFDQTVIPATATDPDQVKVKGIKVGFNIFPVLFRSTLPLEVTLVRPDIHLEQEKDGEWLNLDFLNREKKDLPISFDVGLNVEQADITAIPYDQDPLIAQVDGRGRFNQKQELLEYDLDTGFEQAKAKIKGETKLKTGTTNTKLLVKDLALTDVTSLLPNFPVALDSGQLNADLDINIPSFAEINAANIKGLVNLSSIQGASSDLETSITAASKLNFSGRNADIKNTHATLGEITAKVNGSVNLDTGYDLGVNVLPFQLSSIPQNLLQQIPLNVQGELEARAKVKGAFKDPQVTGRINNTKTVTVDKTAFKQINANFSGNLTEIALNRVNLKPLIGGNLTGRGKLTTSLKQSLKNKRQINVNKMPVQFSFQADLPTQELISPYYQLPPQIKVGQLTAQGKIGGTVDDLNALANWNIARAGQVNTEEIAGSGRLTLAANKLALRKTKLAYGEGEVNVTADANLTNKNWQANLDADSLNLTPFIAQIDNPNLNLNRPVDLTTAKASFRGKLDQLDLAKIKGNTAIKLNVDGGEVLVNSQLNAGNVKAEIIPRNIQINPFITTSLPVKASLQSGKINTSSKLKQLLAFKANPSLDSVKADARLNLNIDGQDIPVDTQIASGRFQANVNTVQIELNPVIPNLPVPASIRSSKVIASGELQELVNFANERSLSTVEARIDADLDVVNGSTRAIARLNNNKWQADINAQNISSPILLDKFAPQAYKGLPLDNINTQTNLSGDIQPLLNNETNISVIVNSLTANTGAQNITAKGDLTLANLTSKPDIANTKLDVAANFDFDRLPIAEVIASASENNELVVNSINLDGKAAFEGIFQGKQLLSAPTQSGNASLIGDLQLQNFAFNNIAFDPVMDGKISLKPGQAVALNLQGAQDVISARAVSCADDDCKLPYLPTNLELRQGANTDQSIMAKGDRQGKIFSLDINNFPLALLNLAPGQVAGIGGPLEGKTTGKVDLNLNTLAAAGQIEIAQPGIGYIKAEQLNAKFNYDSTKNIAELTSSSLDLGDSQYNLNADLDLNTGKIAGKLTIPEAYIQDALTTLRWFTIEDVISLFNIPDYGSPDSVKPASETDTVDQSIARKLNQLRNINRQIQANAADQESGNIPTELDIKGKYAGEIILGGTIQVPEADFKVQGNNWQWRTTKAYPDIVNPLGLVIEESQAIALPLLLIDGNLTGTTVDLNEAKIGVQDAVLSLKGKLSPEQQDAEFAIANLTVDNISNFIDIPVDLAGEINSIGTVKGTFEQPQLLGKIAFTRGALNGNVLPTKLAGNFDYDGSKLGFNTTAPESIRVEAEVPYPIVPGKSDRLTAKANVDKEAFVLLEPLSQNYLSWLGGEGDIQLEANARIDPERPGFIYDLDAKGVANLQDANIKVETPFFTETFEGTGKITLNNQVVNVETLNATFAEKNLAIGGKFPILRPVKNLDNPLTIDLEEEEDINIAKLYKGGAAGQIVLTGTSLAPVIGGEVTLEDGRVSIPKTEPPTQAEVVQLSKNKAFEVISGGKTLPKAQAKTSKSKSDSPIITTLNKLKINLKNFKLSQTPLYNFQLEGGLLLNGTVDKPENIRPRGKLLLTRADVDLLSTTFNAARNRENTIIFRPAAGVFNPNLDIILRTEITEVDEGDIGLAESGANEIPDPLSRANNADSISVFLNIMGETAEILPNLSSTTNNCNIRAVNSFIIENNRTYGEAELNRLTECFNELALSGGNGSQIINSPAVELTSIPARSKGELVNLFGKKFLSFAEQVANSSQSELFDLGVNQFVVAPIRRSVLYRVDDTVVGIGKKVGLDYLRILPNFEGIVELDENSNARSTYNYALQEVRLEYERRF